MPTYYSKKKKTERLSFTITPALKNDLIEFVEKKRKENPKNVEFKSVSSFCYYMIKDVLEIRKKGLDFKKLKTMPDDKTIDFYDRITFKAVIPLFENAIELNKYNDSNIKVPTFLFAYWRYLQTILNEDDSNIFRNIFKKLRSFVLSNNLTREARMDEFSEKEGRRVIIEYIGIYNNLHYNNCKALAALLAILGYKVFNFEYSEKDLYARFDLRATDLLKRRDIARKERMNLLEENMKYMINYEKIINDNDEHLWINLAKFKDIFLNFYTKSTFNNFIEQVIEDINIYSDKEDFLINLLRIFERFHWISIENEKNLSFRILTSPTSQYDKLQEQIQTQIDDLKKQYGEKEEFNKLNSLIIEKFQPKEISFMFDLLKKYASYEKKGDLYNLIE